MQFGIAIPAAADSWRLVRRAEELGFSHAWFFDTQMLSADPFVAMTAAAMKTSRIKLGTGVLIPSNRIAPVAATAFASLNKLAPGRIVFGVSTGFTGRRTMGLGAVKLADMEEYIRVIHALWRGETVAFSVEGKQRKIRLLNPELGLINTQDPIPTYIAASGPKARVLTAKLGAAWIDGVADPERGAASLAQMRSVWQAADQSPEALNAVAWTSGAVLETGNRWMARVAWRWPDLARQRCCTGRLTRHWPAIRLRWRCNRRSPRPSGPMSSMPAHSSLRRCAKTSESREVTRPVSSAWAVPARSGVC